MIEFKDLVLLSLQNENWEGTLLVSVNTLRFNTKERKKVLEREDKNELFWMDHKKPEAG